MKNLSERIKDKLPTLVVFQHGASRDDEEVKTLVAELKGKYGERVDIVSADDSNGELKMRYRLEEYPTWILFKEGQELMRESGHKTVSELDEMIQRAL